MCDNEGNAHADDNAFTAALSKNIELGERLRNNALFKYGNIRKYKSLHKREAENLKDDGEDANQCTEMEFVDYSMVGHFKVGSWAYEFYNSWPLRIVLERDRKQIRWQLVVKSQHCPFCTPGGKCTTLKDLLDHLDTHHQDFSYRPKRISNNSAVVVMKLRENRWVNADLMFLVSTEGYMLSSRMRNKFPNYAPKANNRSDSEYPFVVKHCTPPESYGCSVTRKQRNTNRRIGRDAEAKKIQGGTTEGKIEVGTKARDSKNLPTVRSKLRSSKPNRETANRRTRETGNETSGKSCSTRTTNRMRPPRTRNSVGNGSAAVKRKPVVTVNGIENEQTVHFRNTMFGDNAHVRRAGEGITPILSAKTAKGRIFHTVNNIPLDVGMFNDGFNSDVDDETDWRLKYHDERISSFSDVEAAEKYYLSLWNSFGVRRDLRDKSERGVLSMYSEFLDNCGDEIRRMKLEVPFLQQVALSWEYGVLDANGFMEIMRKFRSIKAGTLHKLPSGFTLPHRLLREGTYPFEEVDSYSGLAKWESCSIREPTIRKWLSKEAETIVRMRKTQTILRKAQSSAMDWIAGSENAGMESAAEASPSNQVGNSGLRNLERDKLDVLCPIYDKKDEIGSGDSSEDDHRGNAVDPSTYTSDIGDSRATADDDDCDDDDDDDVIDWFEIY